MGECLFNNSKQAEFWVGLESLALRLKKQRPDWEREEEKGRTRHSNRGPTCCFRDKKEGI